VIVLNFIISLPIDACNITSLKVYPVIYCNTYKDIMKFNPNEKIPSHKINQN